jgi:two-component system chemotaxis sensor kinase CheA
MSDLEQDDLQNEFVAEALEHLANIEADLLTIEEAGSEIDEELVNKVFRAAHSIKGGSSFLGLNKIKDLAHKAETVLDMVRARQITPNPETTNILLAAFDKLRDLIGNAAKSEGEDITEHVESLNRLASSYLCSQKNEPLGDAAFLAPQGQAPPISIAQTDLQRARRKGQFIYSVEYDLIHDIERQSKNVLSVFNELYDSGEILDCALNLEAVGSLEEDISNKIPLRLIFATILDPDVVGTLLDVAKEYITLLFDPNSVEEIPADTACTKTSETFTQAGPSQVESEAWPGGDVFEPPVSDTPAQSPKPVPAEVCNERQEAAATSKAPASPGESTLRVGVELLESLMNLAGELVLSRNQLREAVARNDRRTLEASCQRINLVTSELQDAIMQTRMQPIGNVFGKFPRVVRDIAHAMNKEINLDIRGKDVELDKSLIEGLSDPLTHMIRNAADHGIESRSDRIGAGKKPAGSIRLEARHEAGLVVVEVSDDGKGLDGRKIAEAALKKGLISQEKLQRMSDKDKMGLVFLPGLSTAEKVSDLSGRGVGMDVVKTNLDRLGGKIEIESEPGAGTLIRIKLPLTLAIIPSLVLTAQGERFAIPQINVVELLRIRAEQVQNRIEVVGDAEVLKLREEIVPIVRFSDFLGVARNYSDPVSGESELCRRTRLADRRSAHYPLWDQPGENSQDLLAQKDWSERRRKEGRRISAQSDMEIVVLTTGIMKYGLVVDSFINTEEIVVKPLGRHFKGLQEYAGATIMGDGKVALILDVNGLAAIADLKSLSGSSRAMQLQAEAENENLKDCLSLLLFHNAPDEVCALPLDMVSRIERITAEQIEYGGGRRTMHYRGVSLPLVTLADVSQVKQIDEKSGLVVIVANVHGGEVGLLGAMPVDVVEARAAIDQSIHRQKGIAGSMIIRDTTVLLSDIYEIVREIYPEWGVPKATTFMPEKEVIHSVLLAEDSDFFRTQVKRFIEEEGYTVLGAPDGEAAWELLVKNEDRVAIVVTDIEMPRLTGLGLTRRIRADSRFSSLPVIGLTSLAGDQDIAAGQAAGITDYQIKLDRDKLIESLHDLLHARAS